MTRANYSDKNLVIDILSDSFDDNKSINYIIKQGKKRVQRIRNLIAYSFDVCQSFGEVYLSDDRKACTLILLPDKKKTTVNSILWDIKLVTAVMGLGNIKKAMERESVIKKNHPEGLKYYLWFIGVKPGEQSKGIGTLLLNEIIDKAKQMNRTICLETSTLKNIPWYKTFGFTIYKELDFGYKLFCMKKE